VDPAVLVDHRLEEEVVASEGPVASPPGLAPEDGAPFDVGEQERYRSYRAIPAGLHRRVRAAYHGRVACPGIDVVAEGDAMPVLQMETVTFLLSDVEGSTVLWEQAPAAMRPALARHDLLFETCGLRARRGHIRPRGEGDSRFAVFSSAPAAVAAARTSNARSLPSVVDASTDQGQDGDPYRRG